MRANWIKAWVIAAIVAPAAFAAIYLVYGLALRSYGLLPGGGAL